MKDINIYISISRVNIWYTFIVDILELMFMKLSFVIEWRFEDKENWEI